MSRLAWTCILLIWSRKKPKRGKKKKKTRGLLLPCKWLRAWFINYRRGSLRFATIAEPSLHPATGGHPNRPLFTWHGLGHLWAKSLAIPEAPFSILFYWTKGRQASAEVKQVRFKCVSYPGTIARCMGLLPCSGGFEGSGPESGQRVLWQKTECLQECNRNNT